MAKETKSTCGSCGKPFVLRPDARWTSLCGSCRIPHQHLSRIDGTIQSDWRCVYCGQTGTYDGLLGTDCTHDYPPCASCGQTPFCAQDCAGMAEILASPEIHKIGF
jgi:hypothetical protein